MKVAHIVEYETHAYPNKSWWVQIATLSSSVQAAAWFSIYGDTITIKMRFDAVILEVPLS